MKAFKAAVGGLVVLASIFGCNAPGSGPARSSGSLGVSNDSKHLYAADSDNGVLVVLDAQSLDKVTEVKVGVRPFRISVGKDDAIYVANRGSRSVSVISHGDWVVVGEIATGVDPVGMQLTSDGKTLYVVSATANDDTSYGILQAIDTATLKESWNLPVGEEPRGLALVKDERAVISLYKSGEIVNVDLKEHQVIEHNVDVYTGVNKSALSQLASNPEPTRTTAPITFHPRAMTDLAVTPDGTRVFGTSMLSREAPILTNPTPATPYYASQGPRLAGSVATTAVLTFDTTGPNVKPLVDDVGTQTYYGGYYGQPASEPEYPQTSFAVSGVDYSFGGGAPTSPVLQGPSVAVVDMTGQWLFMVNRDSQNVAIVATNKRTAKQTQSDPYGGYSYYGNELPSVHSSAAIGHGADGIAILGDNQTAYVYNQFDHTVQQLVISNGNLVVNHTSSPIAQELLPQAQVDGRKMFFDANDRRVSAVTASVACSSCHLEGRDDGHVWMFPDGPRQTPTLAGRGMNMETAPFHWSGEFPTLKAFLEHTITARMGGTGIDDGSQAKLNAFVDAMPMPENPYRHSEGLNAQQTRGSQVFQRAECGTCHSGKWLTNNNMANVGTLVSSGVNPDTVPYNTGLNVPSLRGLARSAPYLHNGAAPTLKDRLLKRDGDLHGKTSNLTNADVDDLVAFLQTL